MAEKKRDDLVGTLYLQLKDMILSGELSPGEKLIQEDLARKLVVSRTPLLRALMMLEGDMLVKSIPRRGMYVRKMNLSELRDAFQLRNSVESMCCGLAAQRAKAQDIAELRAIFEPFRDKLDNADPREYQMADQAFHAKLLELSGNQIVQQMPLVSNIVKFTYQMGLIRFPRSTYEEHQRIIDAIEAGDPQAAEETMRVHLGASIDSLEKRIETEGA